MGFRMSSLVGALERIKPIRTEKKQTTAGSPNIWCDTTKLTAFAATKAIRPARKMDSEEDGSNE